MPGIVPSDILPRMEERYALNFLLVEGEHGWSGRCLEYDFVTQAHTLRDLCYEIQRTVIGHLAISTQAGHRPFEALRRAAGEHWEQFERSRLSVRARDDTRLAVHAMAEADLPIHELQELRIAEAT